MVLRSSTLSRLSNAAAILEDPLPADRPLRSVLDCWAQLINRYSHQE